MAGPPDTIKAAFVLAAGLGTRLRPLTDHLPKPLIPVGLKPLITFAFDHLIADAGVEEFIVNTHHRAEAYREAFPEAVYRGRPLRFRHEPVLLDSAGGIKNIADLLGPGAGTLMVYNGDILTDLHLGSAIAQHRAAGNEVTLLLRSCDGPRHITWDPASGRLLDIRNRLGTGLPAEHALSCGYLVEPAFLERIPAGEAVSVIPLFLDMIRRGDKIGGALVNEGLWRDLGTRAEYLRVHHDLHAPAGHSAAARFPRYGAPDPGWRSWVHPTARIAADARLTGACVVGAGARVGEGAVLEDTILWPGAEIASRCELKNCIVRTSQFAHGVAADQDF